MDTNLLFAGACVLIVALISYQIGYSKALLDQDDWESEHDPY